MISELATSLGASAPSLLMKSTVVMVLGLAVVTLARRTRASVRHAVLASTVAMLAALPLASILIPRVAISIPVSALPVATTSAEPRMFAATSAMLPTDTGLPARATRQPFSWTNAAVALWTVGFAVLALRLLFALRRLGEIRRHGLPWLEARDTVAALAADAGVRHEVDLLLHEDVSAPITCGLRHPAIILPRDARGWSEAALRRALVHELEHIRRGDWFTHLAAQALCAAYWFHPLAWITSRQLDLHAEHACDDAVLEREESTQYAEQLVALARRMSRRVAHPALAMAGRSDLAARISAVLDQRRQRGRAGVRALAIASGAVLLVAILAPLTVVAATTIPGTPPEEAQRRPRVMRVDRALIEAAGEGDPNDVLALLDAGADVNATLHGDGSPLIAAARIGNLTIVTLLLDRGADPNLAVSGDGNPLIMAAGEGHLASVELLLARGADVNQVVDGDENALIQASSGGHLAVVKLLVARGADVNARVWANGSFRGRDGEWRTPLSMARRGGRRAVEAFLISVGATQ